MKINKKSLDANGKEKIEDYGESKKKVSITLNTDGLCKYTHYVEVEGKFILYLENSRKYLIEVEKSKLKERKKNKSCIV